VKLEKLREWKEQVEMKKSRYTEEQVIGAVKQMEAGRKAKELARDLGVSEATLYAWKSKYGGLEVSEARRLRDLEQENARLKKLVADLSLDKDALQTVIRKNGWSL
jgi:putative transposase